MFMYQLFLYFQASIYYMSIYMYLLICHLFIVLLIAKTRSVFTNALYEHIDKQLCRATAAHGMRAFAAAQPLSPRVA